MTKLQAHENGDRWSRVTFDAFQAAIKPVEDMTRAAIAQADRDETDPDWAQIDVLLGALFRLCETTPDAVREAVETVCRERGIEGGETR